MLLLHLMSEYSQSHFNGRFEATVTRIYTPSCFLVAVHNTAATTFLADVDECYPQPQRRRRSIVEDKPFATSFNKDIIMPSR